jgi:mRNA interferase HigB
MRNRSLTLLFALCENTAMRLISRRPLKRFWEKHPDAEASLRHWIKAVESASWKNFAELKKLFGSADLYKQFTVFNISGNKYRLVVVIHYNRQRVYVRHVLTHHEYDSGRWRL